jgi:hypothetical protein
VRSRLGGGDAHLEHEPAVVLNGADHHLIVELDAMVLECRQVDDPVAIDAGQFDPGRRDDGRAHRGRLAHRGARVLDLESERHS